MHDHARAPPMHTVVRSTLIVKAMLISIAVLVLLSVAGQVAKHSFDHPTVFGLVDYFDLNRESNPGTWYQTMALLLAGVLSAAVAVREKASGNAYWRYWGAIACIFVFLSADEGAMIHEATIGPLERIVHIESGMWKPTWVIAALPAVAIVAIVFLPFFFRHLSMRERILTVVAASLFVGGAVGFEMGSASIVFREGYDPDHRDEVVHVIMTHIEEIMEMLAVVVYVHVPLRRLEGHALTVTLRRERRRA